MKHATTLLLAYLIGCSGGSSDVDARLDAGHIDGDPFDGEGPPACNPVEQAPCTVRCTYVHNETETFPDSGLACSEDPGSIAIGGACTFSPGEFDDCATGSVCRSGTCVAFCNHNDVECAVGFCANGELVCFVGCDPTAPACPGGTQCVLPKYPETEHPACAPIGSLAEGAACMSPEDCGAGLTCLGEDPTGPHCYPTCVVAGPACATGSCTPRNAGDAYGVCL